MRNNSVAELLSEIAPKIDVFGLPIFFGGGYFFWVVVH